MNIFQRDIIKYPPIDSNNIKGKENFDNFAEDLISGIWPVELEGAWANLITIQNDMGDWGTINQQVLAIYFNNINISGTIIESNSPILNNYPYDYPDAYISWDRNSWRVWEIYVRPTLRREKIGITLVLLSILYAAQEGEILYCPDTSTVDVIKLVEYLNKYYGHLTSRPEYPCTVYEIYTPFEKIDFVQAEEVLGGV